jgi:toxoflavin synthase
MVNIRVGTGYDKLHTQAGKYGIVFSNVIPIPGGVREQVKCLTNPPFEFEGTTMLATAKCDGEIEARFGFKDFTVLDPFEAPVVKNKVYGDEDWWRDFKEHPTCVVCTAVKA